VRDTITLPVDEDGALYQRPSFTPWEMSCPVTLYVMMLLPSAADQAGLAHLELPKHDRGELAPRPRLELVID
jgi:hypothetical protein